MMPASGDPAQEEGVAGDPAVNERARNQPAGREFERDDGPHDADAGSCPVRPPRRSFLRGALGAGVTGAVTGSSRAPRRVRGRVRLPLVPGRRAGQVLDAEMLAGRLPAVPFHGRYQAGILPKPPRQTVMLSFNVTADGRGELTDLLRTITPGPVSSPRRIPPQVGIGGPPPIPGCSDDGGPRRPHRHGRRRVRLFDDRYGLAAASRPA